MPKSVQERSHFMAPGPHVEIIDDKPSLFDNTPALKHNELDDDDDFAVHHYYYSKKILNRLFDTIDEQEVFQRVLQM